MVYLLMSFLTLITTVRASTAPPTPPTVASHPRLILTPDRVSELQALILSNPTAGAFFASLRLHADWILTQPPVPQSTPGPSGILIPIRTALDYVLSSAATALLLGADDQSAAPYLERATRELLSLSAYSSWNPPHFLDVAEASTAMALGYDWLFPHLNATSRSTIAAAIAVKGVAAYVQSFHSHSWPINETSNWNCVCSSGGMLSVLALVGDAEYPPRAWQDVFLPSLSSIPTCVAAYLPEGSWGEGIGYWGYGSKYIAFAIGALDTAVGTDFDLGKIVGLSAAGRFPIYTTGASGAFFDWADSWAYVVVAYGNWDHAIAPYQGFFARKFNDSAVAYFSQTYSALFANVSLNSPTWGGLVETLLYFSPEGSAADLDALTSAHLYPERALGVFAGGAVPWAVGVPSSPPGSSLHFKGGDTAEGHNHLDLGGWVFDLRGVRIVEDLAADNYNLPNYFSTGRWEYPRLNSQLHNVPRFGGASQSDAASASISVFNFSNDLLRADGSDTRSASALPPAAAGWAVSDLSRGYVDALPARGALHSAVRGWVVLPGATTALIVDELVWTGNATAMSAITNLTVSIHTRGIVTIASDGLSATISVNATGGDAGDIIATTTASLLSLGGPTCAAAKLIAEDIRLPPPQYSTPGLVRISAFVEGAGSSGLATCSRIIMAVGDTLPAGGWDLAPLAEWGSVSPFVVA